MAKVNEKQLLAEGYLKAKITFEIIGKPVEHIKQTIKTYAKTLDEDSRIEIVDKYFSDAQEVENSNGLFSTFAEIDMFIRDTETLTWVAFNFSPASVEILEPTNISFEAREMTNWVNDLLAQLHEVATLSKRVGDQNKLMVKNMNALIKNMIMLATDEGVELDEKTLEKKVGIPHKQLVPFIENLIEKKKIKKTDGKYSRY